MRLWPLCWAGLLLVNCTRDFELGSDYASVDGGRVDASGLDNDAALPACVVTRCEGKVYACGDCQDNDGDQQIDRLDPECLGACDDTEDSYFSAILGKSDGSCKLDCYFDGDNGAGNDDCHWSHRCDPLSLPPSYMPSGDSQCGYDPVASIPGTAQSCDALAAAQSETCVQTCLAATPAGCDCFGCCELPLGSNRWVWLGSTLDGVGSCDATALDDASRCHACTPVKSCSK